MSIVKKIDFYGYYFQFDKIYLYIKYIYCRFGYAGEVSPRGIIRTEVRCPESKKIRRIIDYKDIEDLYQLLVDFLHLLFFK